MIIAAIFCLEIFLLLPSLLNEEYITTLIIVKLAMDAIPDGAVDKSRPHARAANFKPKWGDIGGNYHWVTEHNDDDISDREVDHEWSDIFLSVFSVSQDYYRQNIADKTHCQDYGHNHNISYEFRIIMLKSRPFIDIWCLSRARRFHWRVIHV